MSASASATQNVLLVQHKIVGIRCVFEDWINLPHGLTYMCAQVYTCEYDELVAAMVDMCDVSGGVDTNVIPYYPAPDSAPGSCSCNQGKLLLTLNSITAQTNALYDNKTNVDEAIPNHADQATYWASAGCCFNAYLQSAYVDAPRILDG